MKSLILIGTIATISLFAACRDNNSQQQHDQMQHGGDQHAAVYQCPMKDEGDKTYDKPGTCPKCGMDLKKVE
jgi:Heavy metal binding domain